MGAAVPSDILSHPLTTPRYHTAAPANTLPGADLCPSDLESQQALVDLGALQARLPVGAGRVGAPLVARQVDQGELAVHLALAPQDDLEHGVATRRVGVGRRLARRPGGGGESEGRERKKGREKDKEGKSESERKIDRENRKKEGKERDYENMFRRNKRTLGPKVAMSQWVIRASASSPAAVAQLYELEDVLGTADILLLEPHHLHLLPAVLQHTQLGLVVQQVEHLQPQPQPRSLYGQHIHYTPKQHDSVNLCNAAICRPWRQYSPREPQVPLREVYKILTCYFFIIEI